MKPEKQSYETAGAPLVTTALKIFGVSVLAAVMCLFLYFSVTMLSDGLFQAPQSYTVYEVVDGEQQEIAVMTPEEYNTDKAENPDKYDITDDRRVMASPNMGPKNDVCAALLTVTQVLTQVLMIGLFACMIGYYVWAEGDRDRNLQDYHGRKSTPLRGLWIGLIASVPPLAMYAVLLACKFQLLSTDGFIGVYRWLNVVFMPLVNVMVPVETAGASLLSVGQLIGLFAMQLLTPAVCATAYLLGNFRVLKKGKK